MSVKPSGRRIENFSSADIIAHGREARRKHRSIWTNPFRNERAALWRKGWHRPHDPVEASDFRESDPLLKIGIPKFR